MGDSSKKGKDGRPSWDEYFLGIMDMVSKRGTCDRGYAGCVIVRDNRILTTGYAGSPVGVAHCSEVGHEMHTVTHADGSESKHCIRTTHAEQNAIAQAARDGVSVKGGTVYLSMTPCYICTKILINAGIARVVSRKDYHAAARSKEVLAEAGVEFVLLDERVEEYDNQ